MSSLVSETEAVSLPVEPDSVSFLVKQPTNLFNRLSSLVPVEKVDLPLEVLHRRLKRGRTPGKTIPLSQQILIGVAARIDGTTKAAREYGVTPTTADGYMDGSRQQGAKDAKPHPELKAGLDAVLGKAKDMVADRILGAIASIEVQENGKVRGLDPDRPQASASLAHTLAGVVEKLTPREQNIDSRVQIVVYGPEERSEDRYERITVPLTPEEH